MKYVGKAKYLEPPLHNPGILNAVIEHNSINVRMTQVTASPETLHDGCWKRDQQITTGAASSNSR
jgi:hypothetical protein